MIVFLDIDGVMNTGFKPGPGFAWVLDEAVDNLNFLVSQLKARIVVSSSWRHNATLEELRGILGSFGVEGDIIDVTPSWRPGTTRRTVS